MGAGANAGAHNEAVAANLPRCCGVLILQDHLKEGRSELIVTLNWELTQEVWDSFIALLDADPERAGHRYESVRKKLIFFFRSRQCIPPEDWADEVLGRVIRKSVEEEIRSFELYTLGIAKKVASEAYRDRANRSRALELDLPAPVLDPEIWKEQDQRMNCLEECLQRLFARDRDLVLEYYRHVRQEKIQTKIKMAKELGISMGALRVRASRIRERLADCVKTCMNAGCG